VVNSSFKFFTVTIITLLTPYGTFMLQLTPDMCQL